MSLRSRFVLPVIVLLSLAFLAGCGSNGSPKVVPPPTGSFSNSNLSGTYVFSVSGTDVNNNAFAMVGTITANGSGGNGTGGITGGTIDINDSGFASSIPVITPVSNAAIGGSSTYSVSEDGRGTATLQTSTPFGTIKLDFVLTSSEHGLITEFDGNASGSGTLDLQASGLTQSSLTGSYAYNFFGIDPAASAGFVSAGAFAIGSDGTISSGVADFNDGGLAYAGQPLSGQVLLGPSSTPSTLLSSTSFGLTYDVIAIDSTHLKFIEMDSLPVIAGDAYSQTSATIPTGTLAFTLAGLFNGAPTDAGGFMVSDGAGNITSSSTEDVNAAGNVSSTPLPFSATYASTGSGRFTISNLSGFYGGTQYAAYPSSGGVFLLEIDDGGLMSGTAFPQSSANLATSQGYGLNLSGINLSFNEEVDDIAEFTAADAGTFTGGIIDENFDPGGSPNPKLALNGTFGSIDSTGRYGLSATAGSGSNTTLNGGFALTFYGVDGTTFPFIESDAGQVATGVLVLQNPSASASSAAKRAPMFMTRPIIKPNAARAKRTGLPFSLQKQN